MNSNRVTVDARNESLPNSDIVEHDEDSTLIADKGTQCQWNGVEFQDGDSICAAGMPYECNFGKWVKLQGDC
jgi:hypothetical protein